MHGIPRYREFKGPVLYSQGFRPFFLGAGVWAVLAVAIWLLMVRGDTSLPTIFAPSRWHAHEMLFGFAAAAMAGFVLTAIPNWTGRLPLQGLPLIVLSSTWLLGRVAMATSALIGGLLAAFIDLSFLAMLFSVVLREIVAGRNWRHFPLPVAVAVLIVANALSQFEANGFASSGMLGERLGLATFVVLISLVGGRIIPSFTRNWLAKMGSDVMPTPLNRFDVGSLILVLAALGSWVASPHAQFAGVALAVAGLFSFARLVRWRGWRTRSEPILWILHVGYAWVATGLLLLGGAVLFPAAIPYPAGIHALAVGAIGTMILAVMTRAIRGHTGQALAAGPITIAIYVLITLAAISRVTAPFLHESYLPLLMVSGFIWIAAFSLFILSDGRALLTRTSG